MHNGRKQKTNWTFLSIRCLHSYCKKSRRSNRYRKCSVQCMFSLNNVDLHLLGNEHDACNQKYFAGWWALWFFTINIIKRHERCNEILSDYISLGKPRRQVPSFVTRGQSHGCTLMRSIVHCSLDEARSVGEDDWLVAGMERIRFWFRVLPVDEI